MIRMTRTRNTLLGLALLAAAGAPLQAAMAHPAPPCNGPGGHPPHAIPGPHQFKHWQEHLKNDLHLQKDQMAAWQNFAQVADSNAKAMRHAMETRHQAKHPRNAPERMQARIDFMQQRLQAMRKMQNALKGLYAKLSPTQRTILDLELHPHHRWHHRH